jgi:predicted Zn-dependent peptidase
VTVAPSASGDFSAATITATGLSETFDSWFPIVADLAANASFPADELTLMKQRLAAALRSSQSFSSNAAFDIYERAVYGSAAGPRADDRSFDTLSSDALRAWHRRHYTPSNTVLSIAGSIGVDAAVRRVRGRWAAGRRVTSSSSRRDAAPLRAAFTSGSTRIRPDILVAAKPGGACIPTTSRSSWPTACSARPLPRACS